jgi:hypothetical protein
VSPRTIDDSLREEYFALLPEVRRTTDILEAEVRCLLVPILETLDQCQWVHVESRVKACDSAIAALRRRQETREFEPARTHSLTQSP